MLLKAVRYDLSERGIVDFCKSFCQVHGLDETHYLTKSTLNRHNITLRERIIDEHKDKMLNLRNIPGSSVNLHTDGFDLYEGAYVACWTFFAYF